MNKKKLLLVLTMCSPLLLAATCEGQPPSSDTTQRIQQEQILKELTAQTGMPAIKNARERKLAKQILEMRDQAGLITYTYGWSEVKGELILICQSIGYPLPYATQYTNPQKIVDYLPQGGFAILPQADPNGLFSPESAEASWVMCQNPKDASDVRPVYAEQRLTVSQFPLK